MVILVLFFGAMFILKMWWERRENQQIMESLGESYQGARSANSELTWFGTIDQYPLMVMGLKQGMVSKEGSFVVYLPIKTEVSIHIHPANFLRKIFMAFPVWKAGLKRVSVGGNLEDYLVYSDKPNKAKKMLSSWEQSEITQNLKKFHQIDFQEEHTLLAARFFPSNITDPPLKKRANEILDLASKLPESVLYTDIKNEETSEIKEKLQLGRFGHCSNAWNGKIVTSGGSGGFQFLSNIEVFDPGSGKSSVLMNNAIDRRYHASEVIGDHLYLLGGENSRGLVKEVEVIDLSTKKVTEKLEMPEPRKFVSSVHWDGKIYVMGGENLSGESSDQVDILNTKTYEWLSAPALPEPKITASAVLNGKIYAVGGFSDGDQISSCHRLDIGTDHWEVFTEFPEATSANSVIASEKKLISFGDYNEPGRVQSISVNSGHWKTIRCSYFPSRHNSAVLSDGKIYVTGGNVAAFGSFLNYIQTFELAEF